MGSSCSSAPNKQKKWYYFSKSNQFSKRGTQLISSIVGPLLVNSYGMADPHPSPTVDPVRVYVWGKGERQPDKTVTVRDKCDGMFSRMEFTNMGPKRESHGTIYPCRAKNRSHIHFSVLIRSFPGTHYTTTANVVVALSKAASGERALDTEIVHTGAFPHFSFVCFSFGVG